MPNCLSSKQQAIDSVDGLLFGFYHMTYEKQSADV